MSVKIIQPIDLLSARTHSRVASQLIELTPELAFRFVDSLWWKDPGLQIIRPEGDSHWKWAGIANEFSDGILRLCVAALSPENYVEGALAIRFDARS